MASYTIEIPDGLHHEIQERRHQIDVEDIDRIEIVKGPRGTLYGVSAFAGMRIAVSTSPGLNPVRPCALRTE